MSKLHINAVAFQEGEIWVVQGIEYDISAHASLVQNIPQVFVNAVLENLLITQQLGRQPLEGIKPAPQKFKDMFASAATTLGLVHKPKMMPAVDIRLMVA